MFNPTAQGKTFDPKGDYVLRRCPELAKLSDEWIHQPVAAPPEILRTAGLGLGRDYLKPVVNHAAARTTALAVFARIKSTAT